MKETTYSVTPNGNYIQQTINGDGTSVIKTTPFVDRFMRWLTVGEILDEQEKIDHVKRVAFWEFSCEPYIRGSFNGEHYRRVLEYRELAGIPRVYIHPSKTMPCK